MSTVGPVLPISTASTGAAAPTPSSNELDKDAFLQLLVAQLKYQDPLAPTDPQEFMSQTAQFTTVETLDEISKQNIAAIRGQNMTTASSLIGREVSFLGSDGSANSGLVTGAQLTIDGVLLRVGSQTTTLDDVIEISQATPPPTSPEVT